MPHMSLIWLPNALCRMKKIYDFLAAKDLEAAKSAAKAIRAQTCILSAHPNAGRPASDLEPEHKELVVPFGASGYVVLYRVYGNVIYILSVRHQKEAGRTRLGAGM